MLSLLNKHLQIAMFSKLTLFVGILFLISGCYPSQPKTAEDTDVVATNYDPGMTFQNLKTYYLGDTVVVLPLDTGGRQTDYLRKELNDFIINKVNNNFSSRGFQRLNTIGATSEPDFLVIVSFVNSNISGTTYVPSAGAYNPYWGSYYGWGAGWGYYTPYYPVSYSYNTGTVTIDIVYPKGADPSTKNIPIVWRAVFNGILTDVNNLIDRLNKNIDQAFIQSPYLSR